VHARISGVASSQWTKVDDSWILTTGLGDYLVHKHQIEAHMAASGGAAEREAGSALSPADATSLALKPAPSADHAGK
jgi:hypothetical protein